ncbi:MAG: class I SAM-dependent rRNA methyltransferase [Candidatus Peregrinibacteria bacterium]
MKKSYPVLTIKADRSVSAVFHHPWLFSGSIQSKPSGLNQGDLVQVADQAGKILGTGTYSKSSIAVRLFEFGEAVIDADWLQRKIRQAEDRRTVLGYGPETETTGYRLVFGEADGLPGLVIDRYGDVLALQISTAGMEALKPLVIEALQELFKPRAIVERSDISVRREEGLKEEKSMLLGDPVDEVEFLENGHRFFADVMNGQKTGFYLDQKDLRSFIQPLAGDREALNLFSYTGATNVYLFKGGAKSVLAVDSSADALHGCQKQLGLNRLKKAKLVTEEADGFQWLGVHKEPAYDLVVLDPPGIIKTQKNIEEGAKTYHFLNRAAMRLVRDEGIFVSSSCSHYMNPGEFEMILRRASVQAGVTLDMLAWVQQSPDHPRSLYFPESHYLKSVVARVRR